MNCQALLWKIDTKKWINVVKEIIAFDFTRHCYIYSNENSILQRQCWGVHRNPEFEPFANERFFQVGQITCVCLSFQILMSFLPIQTQVSTRGRVKLPLFVVGSSPCYGTRHPGTIALFPKRIQSMRTCREQYRHGISNKYQPMLYSCDQWKYQTIGGILFVLLSRIDLHVPIH